MNFATFRVGLSMAVLSVASAVSWGQPCPDGPRGREEGYRHGRHEYRPGGPGRHHREQYRRDNDGPGYRPDGWRPETRDRFQAWMRQRFMFPPQERGYGRPGEWAGREGRRFFGPRQDRGWNRDAYPNWGDRRPFAQDRPFRPFGPMWGGPQGRPWDGPQKWMPERRPFERDGREMMRDHRPGWGPEGRGRDGFPFRGEMRRDRDRDGEGFRGPGPAWGNFPNRTRESAPGKPDADRAEKPKQAEQAPPPPRGEGRGEGRGGPERRPGDGPRGGRPGEGKRNPELLKKFDLNGDGRLDDKEKAAAMEMFRALMQEYRANPER